MILDTGIRRGKKNSGLYYSGTARLVLGILGFGVLKDRIQGGHFPTSLLHSILFPVISRIFSTNASGIFPGLYIIILTLCIALT